MNNENALKPVAPHAQAHPHAAAETTCCSHSACGTAAVASTDIAEIAKGSLLFRIPTMDCAVEESEIRRALEPVRGISGLRFRLGERTMAITAEDAALPDALGAQGTFVALNNVVSQSVAHLHTHVVPRTKGDGLRGFFWPRTKYPSDEEAARVAAEIRSAVAAS